MIINFYKLYKLKMILRTSNGTPSGNQVRFAPEIFTKTNIYNNKSVSINNNDFIFK